MRAGGWGRSVWPVDPRQMEWAALVDQVVGIQLISADQPGQVGTLRTGRVAGIDQEPNGDRVVHFAGGIEPLEIPWRCPELYLYGWRDQGGFIMFDRRR